MEMTRSKTLPGGVTEDPPWVRRLLIATALLFLALFLFVPLAAIFTQAFSNGLAECWWAISDRTRWPLSGSRARHGHRCPAEPALRDRGLLGDCQLRVSGQSVLVSLIDLPLAVSPVIAGMVFGSSLERTACSAPG